ncbi:MAG: globin [Ilumatobacteraceae bacterium]
MSESSSTGTADGSGADEGVDTVEISVYEAVGGQEFFDRLVDAFYEGVVTDPVLLPLYPEADLSGARRRLALFLAQYFGGPTTYNDERGHPRLRLRHMPFRIGATERDRWLLHMAAAVERTAEHPQVRQILMGYFVPAAEMLRNDAAPGLQVSASPTGE